MRTVFALIMVIALLSGCQTPGDVNAKNDPPDWLRGEPKVEGMICAVGMSEPTYFKKDAWKYASENARKALARTLSIEINTIMVDITSERGSNINEGTAMEVSSWATNAVVQNSEILEYWHDDEGVISQRKTTYALACIPRKFEKIRHR